MPCIKDQSTVDKLAEIFTSNGRNKGAALREIGYPESTCRSGLRLKQIYANIRVKQAIAKIDAVSSVKLEHNREIAIALLNEALEIARKKNDGPGIVQATRELDAISNLHNQTITNIGDGLSIKIQERAGPKLAKDSA